MSDNSKYVLAIVITVVVGLAPFAQDWLAGPNKRLEYAFDIRQVARTPEGSPASPLRILFGDRQVDHVDTLLLQVDNAGRTPVRRGDFDGDLVVEFGQQTEVLSATGVAAPGAVPALVEYSRNKFVVKPLLLNPGERTVVQALLTGGRASPTVSARIAGLDSLTARVERHVRLVQPWWGVWAEAGIGVLLMSLSVGLLLSFFVTNFRYRGAVVIGRDEAYVLSVSAWIAGWTLLGYWGEKVNFSLHSRIGNMILAAAFAAVNVLYWMNARQRLLGQLSEAGLSSLPNPMARAAAQPRAGADGATQE